MTCKIQRKQPQQFLFRSWVPLSPGLSLCWGSLPAQHQRALVPGSAESSNSNFGTWKLLSWAAPYWAKWASPRFEMKPEHNCCVERKPGVLVDLDLPMNIVSRLCVSVQTGSATLRISEFPALSLTAVDFSDWQTQISVPFLESIENNNCTLVNSRVLQWSWALESSPARSHSLLHL